jgi:hypothetical protein
MFNNVLESDQYIHHPAQEQKLKISLKMTLYIIQIFVF